VAAMFNCLHTNNSCLLVQSVSVPTTENSPASSALLECCPWWSSHDPECWQCVKMCGSSKGSSVLGTTKSCTGPYLACLMVQFHEFFGHRSTNQEAHHKCEGTAMMQDLSIRPKFMFLHQTLYYPADI